MGLKPSGPATDGITGLWRFGRRDIMINRIRECTKKIVVARIVRMKRMWSSCPRSLTERAIARSS